MSKVYRYLVKATRSTAIAKACDTVFCFFLSIVAGFLKMTGGGQKMQVDEKALEQKIEKIRPYNRFSARTLEWTSNDDNVLLSIIVPVYNVEKYLAKCLDSIIDQKTSFKYEVIVTDDGSTDSSAEILARYADRPQFTTFRISNSGLSVARNEGLKRARGKYVMFVDSDDYISENCVETLLSRAVRDGADIVQGSYCTVDVQNNVQRKQVFKDAVLDHADPDKLELSGYAWGKVIRRELMASVQFPDGMGFEDTVFAFILLPMAKGYVSSPEPVYYYRVNPVGLTAAVANNPKALDTYWIVLRMLEHRKSLGMRADNQIFKRVKTQFGALLYGRIKNFDDDVKKTVFYLCCLQVEALRKELGQSNAKGDDLDYAFRTRNYALWKLLCYFEFESV
jgi:glycosyltransferase involved in cell wall biosynthesis